MLCSAIRSTCDCFGVLGFKYALKLDREKAQEAAATEKENEKV